MKAMVEFGNAADGNSRIILMPESREEQVILSAFPEQLVYATIGQRQISVVRTLDMVNGSQPGILLEETASPRSVRSHGIGEGAKRSSGEKG